MLQIHPLIREADIQKSHLIKNFADSSTHTMGRLTRLWQYAPLRRFIPSYDGQTARIFTRCLIGTIHPLTRGADTPKRKGVNGLNDSSPHTRGRPSCVRLRLCALRFIPSHEGQTLSVYAAFSRLKHLVVQFAQMPFLSHSHIQYAEKSAAFSFFFKLFFIFFNPHHQRHSGSV